MKLNAEQRAALDRAAAAGRAKLTARVDAEEAARKLVADRTTEAAQAESRRIREALALGVPKSHVMREVLHTQDWHTVERVLALTQHEADAEQAVLVAELSARMRLGNPAELAAYARQMHPGDTLIRVDWADYQADPASDVAYLYAPTVQLRGFIHREREPRRRRGVVYEWAVLEDDTDPDWPKRPHGPLQEALDTEQPVREAIDALVGGF